MLTVAVLAGVLALASAHGQNNWMGGNQGGMGQQWGMGNQWGGMNGHFGQGTMGNQQQMMGGMGQNWMQMLQMMMNQQNMRQQNYGQNNQGQNWGQQNMGQQNNQGQQSGRQGGVMESVLLLLIQNMMNGNNRGQQGGNSGMREMDREEYGQMEEMMRKQMTMEMADMMMLYMDFKEKEKTFSESMEAVCFMVNATYSAYTRRGQQPFTATTDESMEALAKEFDAMNEMEKMESAINIFNTNQQQYGEIFLRLVTWSCMSGDAYVNAAMKMEKAHKQSEGECGRD